MYNNFYGPQYHGRAHFGIGAGAGKGGHARATGLLEADEIDALLRSYVRPDCFDDAARELTRTGVVVLAGPQGTGKRSAAVALLRETVGPSADYVVLSPDIGLDQLAERSFDSGVGYVVLDRTAGGDAPGRSTDFDWRRVRDQVRRHRAHLVITTVHGLDGPPPEAVRHLQWQPPAVEKVVRARLVQGRVPQETVTRAVADIPARCPVAVAAEAADRIAAGDDPGQVWKEHTGSAPRAVQDWFGDEGERTLHEIAEVTTLAFAPGVGRRDFESLQEILEQHLEPVYFTPEPPPSAETGTATPGAEPGAAPPTPPRRRARPADRRRSLARNALVTTEMQLYGSTTREVMVFADPELRRWVLRELWRGYPTEYWDAVRDWLATVIDGRPGPDLQLSIASGLALLGHVAFDEVVECYLGPWARGVGGESGQDTALYVLWYMCLEETPAAAALTLARTWAQSANPRLRSTALGAFGGQLGVSFPTDAVRWLWVLLQSSLHTEYAAREVMDAWARLFLVLVDCRQDAGIVLEALAYRIGREQRTRSAAYSPTGVLVLGVCLRVLTVREPLSGRSAIARYTADRPGETALAAQLWAAVICHRPLRRNALTALLGTARTLPTVTSDPTAAAERLGRALADALPPVEHPLLASELSRLAAARQVRPTDPDCVAVLLGALNRAKDSDPQ
ncbi:MULTISPECIES: hypothetical protein [unclassified Streptomyces]|uniref:hypothetical protein n=1 Tax=unclassified Streptomyces TaxID=2593676 RepID=UPI0032515D31